MGKWGSTNFKQFEELKKRIDTMAEQKDAFIERTTNELGQRLLRRVKQKTPVGVAPDVDADTYAEHWTGYQGGTLRKGWKAEGHKDATSYEVEISNSIEYASYVEYGHRQNVGQYVPALGKRLKSPWVEGTHMLQSSEEEIKAIAPALIDKRFKEFTRL